MSYVCVVLFRILFLLPLSNARILPHPVTNLSRASLHLIEYVNIMSTNLDFFKFQIVNHNFQTYKRYVIVNITSFLGPNGFSTDRREPVFNNST